MRFDRKVAIVTGGASGIGAAIVSRLAAEGAKVAVLDLAPPVELSSGQRFVPTDVADAAQVQAAIAAVLAEWGRLDVLVNNAGIGALAYRFGQRLPEAWPAGLAVILGIR